MYIRSNIRRPSVQTELNPGTYDFALAEISPHIKELADEASTNLFNSMGFCELYANPPAQRLWLDVDNERRITRAYAYREERWARLFKTLHMFGPVDLTMSQLNDFMLQRGTCIATIYSMELDHVTAFRGPWYRSIVSPVNEDIVIDLPATVEDYLSLLGRKTREHLPYYLRRLRKEWGNNLEILYLFDHEISTHLFSELVGLNRTRIERKGGRHLWDYPMMERRSILAQKIGFLCGLRFGGQLVSGTMSYIHHNEAYLILIGHDPQYDRLNLGNLTLWLTINRLIELGISRYHLLWGEGFYKFQFGGSKQILHKVILFRNPCIAAIWQSVQLIHQRTVRAQNLGRSCIARVYDFLQNVKHSPFPGQNGGKNCNQ
jgi:hypothetical protein